MRCRSCLWTLAIVIAAVDLLANCASANNRPNTLWLTSEDHGPHMGCYGDRLAMTPNVDALARKGMLFRFAWSTVPVCAPARTAIITGMYSSSNGVLVAMSALAAVESLEGRASGLHERILSMDPVGPMPDARHDSYVPRLIQNIREASGTPKP